jgi:hypothetical protein
MSFEGDKEDKNDGFSQKVFQSQYFKDFLIEVLVLIRSLIGFGFRNSLDSDSVNPDLKH